MGGEPPNMEAVLGDMRGRLPGVSRLALVPLVVLTLVCVAAIGLLGYRLVIASGAFDVEHVHVRGAGRSSAIVEQAVYQRYGGRSMLQLDPNSLAASIAALPYVHAASVDRAFPNTLSISVVPEHAVALAPTSNGRVVLAASGRVLGPVTRATMGLPLIAAAPADLPGVGGVVRADGVLQELALAAASRPGLRFASIGFGSAGLTGRTSSGLAVQFGDSGDVTTKLKVARSVLRRASANVQYVDVSVPAAPVMRESTPDALTANAPPPTVPPVPADSAGGSSASLANATPAQSIRTLFG